MVVWTVLAFAIPSLWSSRVMRFLCDLSLFGVYFMNWIGALWEYSYIGLYLAIFGWLMDLYPWDVLTYLYRLY